MSGFEGAIVRRRKRRHIRQTVRVADAFPIVIIGVSIVAIVVAVVVSLASGGLYDRIGRGGTFGLDSDGGGRPSGPAPGSPAARAEASEEIRQLVEAKSARRVARGQAPLDVDAEIAALTQPAAPVVDESLREEVRQLVVARNERRMARGQEPLDVESEVDRQLRDLGP
jgi:hypothetical protein